MKEISLISSSLLIQLLSGYQICKKSLLFHESFIGSTFNDFSLIQYYDTITFTDR